MPTIVKITLAIALVLGVGIVAGNLTLSISFVSPVVLRAVVGGLCFLTAFGLWRGSALGVGLARLNLGLFALFNGGISAFAFVFGNLGSEFNAVVISLVVLFGALSVTATVAVFKLGGQAVQDWTYRRSVAGFDDLDLDLA